MYDAFIAAFIALFVIIDPVGIAPVFASLTEGTSKHHKRSMAFKGTIVALLIMVFFAYVGKPFLITLGISMDAMRIAGGIMMFLIALEMVMEKRAENKQESADKLDEFFEDISVFPIALPLLAGPGSIATIMLLMNTHEGDLQAQGMVIAALSLVMLISLIVFLLAGKIMSLLGPTVNSVITRVLGIILAALAAQYVIDGLKGALIS